MHRSFPEINRVLEKAPYSGKKIHKCNRLPGYKEQGAAAVEKSPVVL
jgi:hypothetical protein